MLCWLWLTSCCWSREPQTHSIFVQSAESHGTTKHCYNWMLGMTPVVGGRCISKVKAVEVHGTCFESDEAHPSPNTFAQQTHQTSWFMLSGKEPWHLPPTSSLAIKNGSMFCCQHVCVCVCFSVCAFVSGQRSGSLSFSKETDSEVTGLWSQLSPLSCLSTCNKCCVV